MEKENRKYSQSFRCKCLKKCIFPTLLREYAVNTCSNFFLKVSSNSFGQRPPSVHTYPLDLIDILNPRQHPPQINPTKVEHLPE